MEGTGDHSSTLGTNSGSLADITNPRIISELENSSLIMV
jgi:hypothetical protein